MGAARPDRSARLNGGVIARPPLPPGPFLVVGLARSGVAAAHVLAGLGERVIGTDARVVGDDVRAALVAAGVEVRDGEEGADLLAGISDRRQEPRGAARGAGRRRGARRRAAGHRRGGAGMAAARARVHRPHRLQRQDDDGRADRAHPPHGRAARRRGGQRRHRAGLAAGHARAGDGGGLRGLVVPARGHRGLRARGRGAAQPRRGPPGSPRHVRRVPGGEARACSRTSRRARSPSSRPGSRSTTRAGRPSASRSATAPEPDLSHRDGTLYWRGERLMAAADIRLRGAHNRENAMAAAAVCLARGIDPDAVRDGADHVRRGSAPARGDRRQARRHCTSTTPRPRTSRRPRSACSRSRAACT